MRKQIKLLGFFIFLLVITQAQASTGEVGARDVGGQAVGSVASGATVTQNHHYYGGMLPPATSPRAQTTPFLHEVPHENEFFVDRKTPEGKRYLEEMGHILGRESSPPRSSKRLVLTGMDGVGKKQLAFAYAWKYFKEGTYSFVGHITSDTPEMLTEGYTSLAKILRPKSDVSTVNCTSLLKKELGQGYDSKPWLLIYSGAQPEKFLLKSLLPSGGHVIILSSLMGWENDFSHVLPIDGFSPEESVDFLFRKTRLPRHEVNMGEARCLASNLHFYPLALHFAALDLLKLRNFSEYNRRFQLSMSESQAAQPADQNNLQKVLKATFSVMQGNLSGSGEAMKMLRYIYYLQADRIPLYVKDFLSNGEEILQELERCHHIKIDRDRRRITMHPLIQSIGRQENEPNREADILRILDHIHQYWHYQLGGEVEQSTWAKIAARPRFFTDNPHLFGEACVSYQNLVSMEVYVTSDALKVKHEVVRNFMDEIKDAFYSLLLRERLTNVKSEKELERIVEEIEHRYGRNMPEPLIEWLKIVSPLIPDGDFDLYFSLVKNLEAASHKSFDEAVSIVHAILLLEKVKKTHESIYSLFFFFSKVKSTERKEIARNLSSTLCHAVEERDLSNVLKVITELQKEKRSCTSFFNDVQPVLKHARNGSELTVLIKAFHQIYPKLWDDFLSETLPLMGKLTEEGKIFLLEKLSIIPDKEMAVIMPCLLELTRVTRKPDEISTFLNVIRSIEMSRRHTISCGIACLDNVSLSTRKGLMIFLRDNDQIDRGNFVENVKLLRPYLARCYSSEGVTELFRAFISVEPQNRQSILNVVSEQAPAVQIPLLCSLSKIEVSEVLAVLDFCRPYFNSSSDVQQMIESVGAMTTEKRNELKMHLDSMQNAGLINSHDDMAKIISGIVKVQRSENWANVLQKAIRYGSRLREKSGWRFSDILLYLSNFEKDIEKFEEQGQ